MAEENKHNNYWLLTWEENCSDDSSNDSTRKNGNKQEESSDSSDGSSDSSELEEGSTFTESSEEEDESSDSESGDENPQFPPGIVHSTGDPSTIIGGDVVAEEIVGSIHGRQPFEEIIGEEVVGDTGHDEVVGNDNELLIAISGDSQSLSDRKQNCVVQYMDSSGLVGEGARFTDVMDVNDVAGEVVVRKKPAKKKKKAQSKSKELGKASKSKGSASGTSVKKAHECPICDKMFSSREAIRTHMKLHSDPDLFRCKICDKDFKFKQSLQRHMSHHTGEFPFYCRICGKGFVKGARCRDHERVHLKELDKAGQDKPSSKSLGSLKSDRRDTQPSKSMHLDDDDDDDDDIEDVDDFATHPDENPWAQSDSEESPPKKPDDLQIGAYEEIESADLRDGKDANRKRKRKSKSPLKLKIKIGQ